MADCSVAYMWPHKRRGSPGRVRIRSVRSRHKHSERSFGATIRLTRESLPPFIHFIIINFLLPSNMDRLRLAPLELTSLLKKQCL